MCINKGWSCERPAIKIGAESDYHLLYRQALETFSPTVHQPSSPPRHQSMTRQNYQGSIGSGTGLFSRCSSRGNSDLLIDGQTARKVVDEGVMVHAPLLPPIQKTTGSASGHSSPQHTKVAIKLYRSDSFLDEGMLVEDLPADKTDVYGVSALSSKKRLSRQESIDNVPESRTMRNIASCLTLHGVSSQQAAEDLEVDSLDSRMNHTSNCSNSQLRFSSQYESWIRSSYAKRGNRLDNGPCRVTYTPLKANGYDRSASIITNGQAVIPTLLRPVMQGTKMFRVQAYLHQYLSAGLEQDDLITAFRSVTQTVNNYRDLK